MLKQLMSFLLVVVFVLGTYSEVLAKKTYSSGSRSSSSRSSSGRSYSSGSKSSSSKGSSFATKPSSNSGSGKSYSSGSSGKSYSSGSSGKSYSSGSSGKSYSSGSSGKSYSSGSSPMPSSGKKYADGNPPPSTGPPNKSADGNSRKPKSSGFNSALSNDAKRVESQKRYEPAAFPKSTYTSKGLDGKTVQQPIKQNSPQVQNVRRYVTNDRYATYGNRSDTFYHGYSPMYYHDPFSPFLMGWIMSDAINSHQRAMWMYHHQSDMDSNRYNEMLKRDAGLQAEIDQLKAQNLAHDPNYIPPELADNPDLMFSKDFVDAAYNPVETKSAGTFFFWSFIAFVVLVVGGLAVYFFFVKEY